MLRPIRLMTLAPGHFHAALVQKQPVPGIHPRAYVYAPLDADLLAHLGRVMSFNQRTENPTAWELDVRTGGDHVGRMLREQPGNTVVIAGRNRGKIDAILGAVANGLHVLADKPWIIDADEFAKLERVQHEADLRDLVAWDMMTERFEVTTALQRELVRDPEVFGEPIGGTADAPCLTLESVHYLRKSVAGVPLRRPSWWFDPNEAGFALADVGTHLVDLAFWLLFPDVVIDHHRDVAVLDATVWPTQLTRQQFMILTGLGEFPPGLPTDPDGVWLAYQGNGTAVFTVGGVHVRMTVLWEYEPGPAGGDRHEAVVRGTKSRIAVVSVPDPAGGVRLELFVEPVEPALDSVVRAATVARLEELEERLPGVTVVPAGRQLHVRIPERLRTRHEDHFAEVVREFAGYFHEPRRLPVWAWPNLLAKYHVTTRALSLARAKQARAST